MHCPKCRAVLPELAADCPYCGIILAKYHERDEPAPAPMQDVVPPGDVSRDALIAPRMLLTHVAAPNATASVQAMVGRAIFLLFVAVWTLRLIGGVSAERVGSSFLHLPNLVFHEAGHILFSPLGRFLTVLGGSLTQVLVPLVCAGAFLLQAHDAFGAAIAVWWAGENLLDVAYYINDARDLKLVLLGGKTGAEVEGHDWEYLLNAMSLAHKDHAIAAVVQTIGNVTMIAAVVCAALVVLNQITTQPPGALTRTS